MMSGLVGAEEVVGLVSGAAGAAEDIVSSRWEKGTWSASWANGGDERNCQRCTVCQAVRFSPKPVNGTRTINSIQPAYKRRAGGALLVR